LGTGKEEADTTRPQPVDYELAEKFDIRLSRIQEELEAARWEKNLLLEKMRMKEMEEKKNRARIDDLEARLKGELRGAQLNARELEQTRHLTDLTERSETAKQIEEIKREELSLEKYLVPERDSEPEAKQEPAKRTLEPGVKTLKSIAPTGSISLKRLDGTAAGEEAEDTGMSSRKLKSLGQTQAPAYVYPGAKKETPAAFNTPAPEPAPEPAPRPAPAEPYGSYRETPLASPEPAPAGAYKGFENMEPLPQQEAGLVYDFTVVTAKPEGTSQQFKIETGHQELPHFQAQSQSQAQSQAPAHTASPMEFVPVSAPHPFYQQPQAFNPSMGQAQQAQSSSFSPSPAPSPAPSAAPFAAEYKPGEPHKDIGASEESPDKTQRLSAEMAAKTAVKTAVAMKDSGKAGAAQPGPKKKGGKMAFVVVILIFGFIAAGGLGYFFLGEGVSFSEFSMMNFGSKKTAGAAAKQESAAAQQEGAAAPAAAPEQAPAQPAADAGAQQQQPAPGSQPAGAEQQAPQAAVEKPSENIRRALDIVKTY
ncbi:MAG: hypothetical protein NTY45_15195, partial [Elusimicrobia bacterium]|nr:hypothetical protein [Elusimicrobiota bacterium]